LRAGFGAIKREKGEVEPVRMRSLRLHEVVEGKGAGGKRFSVTTTRKMGKLRSELKRRGKKREKRAREIWPPRFSPAEGERERETTSP